MGAFVSGVFISMIMDERSRESEKCYVNIGFTINPNRQGQANLAKLPARKSLTIFLLYVSGTLPMWSFEV